MVQFLRDQPLSIGFAVVLVAIGLITGTVTGPAESIRDQVVGGWESVIEQRHWWAPLTSSFFAENGFELLFAVIAAVAALGAAERMMGTARTALTALVGSISGIALGLGIQVVGVAAGDYWSTGIHELGALDPFTPIVASLMAASGFAGVVWRRRIRVLTLSAVTVLLLFGGQPSDLYRWLAALAGLALGSVMAARPIEHTWRRSSFFERRRVLAALVGLVAVGPIVTLYSGGRFGILAPLGLLLTQNVPPLTSVVDRCLVSEVTRQCAHELTLERLGGIGPVLVSVLPLVALVIAAIGMARGRQLAAQLAIVLNLATALAGAWYFGLIRLVAQPLVLGGRGGRYWEIGFALVASVLVPLVLAVLIIANRRAFRVRSRPRLLRRFAITLITVVVGLSAVYVGLGWILRDQFHPRIDLIDLIADLPERFIPIGFLRLEPLAFRPLGVVAEVLYQSIGPVFWIVVIVGAVLCLRTSAIGPSPADRAALTRILLAGGGGSLSYMSTWAGNSLWFDDRGTTAIAYRVSADVAITLGEPIGPEQDATRAITAFARMCDDRGWTPVFYSVGERLRSGFDAMGWPMMRVAEETVLRPRSWSTTGKKWQDIRSSINRADRAGIRAEWSTHRALSPILAAQVSAISEQWVQEKSLPEMGFTLGGLDELRDERVGLMLAIGPDERVEAVTSWLPSYRDGVVIGWTLDFMRRRPESMNGMMEFVIAKTAVRMAGMPEVEFLSLSAAPLAPAEQPETPDSELSFAERVLETVGRRLEPVYGFRSLLSFKRKFQPEFSALFMAYPDQAALPVIGLALARAYLPTLSLGDAISFVRVSAPTRRGALVE